MLLLRTPVSTTACHGEARQLLPEATIGDNAAAPRLEHRLRVCETLLTPAHVQGGLVDWWVGERKRQVGGFSGWLS